MKEYLIQKRVMPGMPEYRDIIAIYEEAFPPVERYPLDMLEKLAQCENVEYLAFYDGEMADGAAVNGEATATPCGFAFNVIAGGYLYVVFLAVNAHVRSRGYGTRILAQMRAENPSCMTVLEIEPIDPAAENNDQRLRRLEFYERNGFSSAGCILREEEMDYAVLVAPPLDDPAVQFDPDKFVFVMERATDHLIPLEIV